MQTEVVVNAAGVSAATVGVMAGLRLLVASYRRQVAVLSPGRFGHATPIVMDGDSGWYMHVQVGGAILLGGIDKDTHPGLHEVVDPAVTTAVIEIGLSRVPRLAETSLIRSYSGLRALTPDDLPILGPTRSLPGYYCACGLAGHGFMHAPAVGMLLRDWILDGEPHGFEAAAVAPDRFGAPEGV
jgi:sarcosine oxidase subunit beta